MRMYDLIMKKRLGGTLSDAEINFILDGYTKGDIPDYQISAFLMAVCFQGMTAEETASLTNGIAASGDMVDLSSIPGIKVDKHSTGGVGDKTTLIIAPMVAACGVPVAMMSGRGLGHTGGTLDKLEAIPGLSTSVEPERFLDIVKKIGVAVVGQTGNLAPADKKLYALRDVTATIDCMPLIASSIMSKKIAAGADAILLDVKTGSGAFMKTINDSIRLAETMVAIGEHVGRHIIALITNMDTPLGYAIGNSLEVMESVEILKGQGPADLTELCIQLAANMLYLAEKADSMEGCIEMAKKTIADGSALAKFKEMVAAEGGDVAVIDDFNKFPQAAICHEVKAPRSGYITAMQTERCGIASVVLGAGRETKDSVLDMSAGILLVKKTGDAVKEGETIATLYTSKQQAVAPAEKMLLEAITIEDTKPEVSPLIYARVAVDGVQRF